MKNQQTWVETQRNRPEVNNYTKMHASRTQHECLGSGQNIGAPGGLWDRKGGGRLQFIHAIVPERMFLIGQHRPATLILYFEVYAHQAGKPRIFNILL